MYENKIRPLLEEMSKGKLNTNQMINKLKLFETYSSTMENLRDTDYNELKNYK